MIWHLKSDLGWIVVGYRENWVITPCNTMFNELQPALVAVRKSLPGNEGSFFAPFTVSMNQFYIYKPISSKLSIVDVKTFDVKTSHAKTTSTVGCILQGQLSSKNLALTLYIGWR